MNLANLRPGQMFAGVVKVVGKRTPGPVVLRISDGSFTMDAVGSSSLSAMTGVEVGDMVELTGPAMRRLGKVQVEVKTIVKTAKELSVSSGLQLPTTELMLRTDFNEGRLKPLLVAAAARILHAVIADQPVILRHHADADGSCGAMVLEKAVQDICRSRGMKPEQYVYRMPSKAPFYDVADALWDAAFAKRTMEARGLPKPLIVVIDNGSTSEDVFALKLMHALGFSLMVVDHHHPGKLIEGACAVDLFLDVHVNPLIVGGNYWSTSGMMCYEIAHFINPAVDLPVIPAISAIADRSQSEEGKGYIVRCGKTREELKDLAVCFDFLAYTCKNDAATSVFESLLTNPGLVEVIVGEVKEAMNRQLGVLLPRTAVSKIGRVTLAVCDLTCLGDRFSFPPAGKLTGLVHDVIVEKEKDPVMTAGVLPGLVILRESSPVLPVRDIVERFKSSHPGIPVSGGGHDVAGTIKCPPDAAQAVIGFIKTSLQGLPQFSS